MISNWYKSAVDGIKNIGNNVSSAAQGKDPNQVPCATPYVVGSHTIVEEDLLGEGGYAFIWRVRDVSTGKHYALKKLLCQNQDAIDSAKKEVSVLKDLIDCENVVGYIDSGVISKQEGKRVIGILLEFCSGGTLYDMCMKYQGGMSIKQMMFILKDLCSGLIYMHETCNPPITHRDIKVENVLLQNKKFKFCDFGSCSRSSVNFATVPFNEIYIYETEFEKYTTMLYRPPEMVDVHLKYVVDTKVDIWMMGCVLFALAFNRLPFPDGGKLAIRNAHYMFPRGNRFDEKFCDLCRWLLTPNPSQRPSARQVLNLINRYDEINEIPLCPEVLEIKKNQGGIATKPTTERKKQYSAHEDIPIEELQREAAKLRTKVASKEKGTKKKRPQFKEYYPEGAVATVNQKKATADTTDFFGNSGSNQPDFANFDAFNSGNQASTSSTPSTSKNDWDPFSASAATTSNQSSGSANNGGFDFFGGDGSSTSSTQPQTSANGTATTGAKDFDFFSGETATTTAATTSSTNQHHHHLADFDPLVSNKSTAGTTSGNGLDDWGAFSSGLDSTNKGNNNGNGANNSANANDWGF